MDTIQLKTDCTIDLDYILTHYDQNKYVIPHSFDTINWRIGETYKIRVGNIYDPSKFWIVRFEEELSLFHQYLNSIYKERKSEYRMPKELIKRNHYCVVYTDGAFYRGIIVNIPKFATVESKVVVFLFDFGFTNVITIENVYFLSEKLYELPRYAIRACLNDLEPVESEVWTNKAVEKFHELTKGKVLCCVLEEKDYNQKVIYVRLGEMLYLEQIGDISGVLILEKMARSATKKSRSKKGITSSLKLVPKVKYPFLFPSFQALESGLMPSTVYITEMLKQCPTSSILLKPYYSYNGINLRD